MADLMTDTYDYNSLANKYGNFHLPAVKLMVGGTDILSTQNLILTELSVVLSMTTASSAQFKIANIYNKKNRSFKSGIADKFKPGTIVEIFLGYYSSVIKVLKGFVYMLGAEFGELNQLVVTVMDVRKLMMISGTKHLLHDAKNYSDVFKTIMSAYSKLCAVQADATSDKLEAPVSQVGTDYDFVMEELVRRGKCGREFFVVADKAYLRKRPTGGSPIMQLEFGRELLELQMDYRYLDLEIEVNGYHPYEQTAFSAKAAARSGEAQVSLLSPTPVELIADPDADTQEKAKNRAAFMADSAVQNAKSGRCVTVGLPEIVPGRFIEVVKLEKMVNKKYYITEVRHRLDNSFYTTEFDIGGWC